MKILSQDYPQGTVFTAALKGAKISLRAQVLIKDGGVHVQQQ